MNTTFSASITTLLSKLQQLQSTDGSFASESVLEQQSGTRASMPSPNIFSTAIIGTMLPPGNPEAAALMARSMAFLLDQQQQSGSWNYWQASQHGNQRYPDDLDDTAMSIAALLRHAPERVTGAMTAHIAHILNACEHGEGGPYNTWITDWQYNSRFSDVDGAVNANVAYCLSLLGVTLPKLHDMLTTIIAEQDFYSEYYCSPIIVAYFIARVYQKDSGDSLGSYRQELVDFLLFDDAIVAPSSAFETACAVSALCMLGERSGLQKAVSFLQKSADSESCVAVPWYREQKTSEGMWHCQSEAVTVAACIEALWLYSNKNGGGTHDGQYTAEHSSIVKQFLATVSGTPYEHIAKRYAGLITEQPFMKEMMTLPFLINDAFAASMTKETLLHLAVSTTAGIIGYTIIDGIMDHDATIDALPFAIQCVRSLSAAYAPYRDIDGVQQILEGIDRALHEEYSQRLRETLQPSEAAYASWALREDSTVPRLPLHEKSLGLILPALVICATTGMSQDRVSALVDFYRHYLSIRQRTDDAHDVIADIAAGRQTPTVAMLLREFQREHPDKRSVAAERDSSELLQVFWQHCFNAIHRATLEDIAGMEQALPRMECEDSSAFAAAIRRVVRQEDRSMLEFTRVRSFLATY